MPSERDDIFCHSQAANETESPPPVASEPKRRELRRAEACKRLNCSTYVLWKFEKDGKLRVRRERVGESSLGPGRVRAWIDEGDVELLKKTWKPNRPLHKKQQAEVSREERAELADLSARVLPLFVDGRVNELDEGGQLVAIAEICRLAHAHVVDVRNLYEEWILGLDGSLRQRILREHRESEKEAWKERSQTKRYETYREFKARERAELKEIAQMNLMAEQMKERRLKIAGEDK